MSKNRRRIPVAEPEPEPELEVLPQEEPIEEDAEDEVEEDAEEAQIEKEPIADNKPAREGIGAKTARFFASLPVEKARLITGFLCLFLSVLLFLALVSHFLYWWVDFDVVQQMQSGGSIWDNLNGTVRNFVGRLGAYIAFSLVNNGFGLAAFILPMVLLQGGLHILHIRKYRWLKIFFRSVFGLLFFSILFGTLFQHGTFYVFGGSVGLYMSQYLNGLVGKIGLAAILLFAVVCYGIINYNVNKWIKKQKEKKARLAAEKAAAEKLADGQHTVQPVGNIPPVSNPIRPTEPEEDPLESMMTLSERMGLDGEQEEEDTETDEMPMEEEDNEDEAEDEEDEALEAQEEDGSADGEMQIIDTRDTTPNEGTDKDLKKVQNGDHIGVDTPYDPRLDLADYKFPTLDLLEDYGDQTQKVQDMRKELEENKNRIVSTLRNYGIEISKISATIGPTVTLYEIVPAAGVRISKIKNLEDDIALSLSALGIRIIAPIPGKGTIGIEVPNSQKQIVPMRDMLTCDKFLKSGYALPIAIGKTISNEQYVADLTKMPHLLVAGATGQGKSVGLNAIVSSLLYSKHPAELKFVMVDPKKVELTLYNKIERHYLAKLPDSEEAIITDVRKVVRTLNSLCIEMDNRYELLKDAQVRNLKEYNQKFISRRLNPEETVNGELHHHFLPYIVLVIDEFADLIMTAGREVEQPIARLAQLARAIGIHLVIATQRPTVNIITGTIKANFPARMAFKVMQKNDSRTILDANGADQLIGRGDMLISAGEGLIRLQCALIDTPEIERITDFIGSQRGYPDAYRLPDCPDDSAEGGKAEVGDEEWDSMFREAAELVVSTQQGSTSMLQRKFKLGYNRAGRIMDQLETAGVVGPFDGKKTREVKIKDPMALEQIFTAIGV